MLPCLGRQARRGSSVGKEVAAAGGVWGEIFLEVAGKQALWHTPSWPVLRSSAGRRRGGGVRGTVREPRGRVGGGEQGSTDSFALSVSGMEHSRTPSPLGRRGTDSSAPATPPRTRASRSALRPSAAPTPRWDPSLPLPRRVQDSRGKRRRQRSVPAEFGV